MILKCNLKVLAQPILSHPRQLILSFMFLALFLILFLLVIWLILFIKLFHSLKTLSFCWTGAWDGQLAPHVSPTTFTGSPTPFMLAPSHSPSVRSWVILALPSFNRWCWVFLVYLVCHVHLWNIPLVCFLIGLVVVLRHLLLWFTLTCGVLIVLRPYQGQNILLLSLIIILVVLSYF